MASRLKSSRVREGAKALQPLALVALVGIVGTVTLLGGCGGSNGFSNTTDPSPLIPVPISPGASPTPTPSGSPGSPGPSPSGSASPTPTPSTGTTPDPSSLKLTQALNLIKSNASATVSALALGPDDRWAITYSVAGATAADPTTYGYYLPSDAPLSLKTALDGLVASSARIRSVTLGAGDVWLVTYNQTSDSFTDYLYNGIDANMLSRLISLRLNQNINVKSAVIGPDPAVWSLIVNQNLNYSQGLPAAFTTALNSYAVDASVTIDHIALGADNTYAVVYNSNQIAGTASGLVNFVNDSAGVIRTNNYPINGIGLGLAGSYAIVYNNNLSTAVGTTRSR